MRSCPVRNENNTDVHETDALIIEIVIYFLCSCTVRARLVLQKRATADNYPSCSLPHGTDHRDPSRQRRHSSIGIFPAFPNRPKTFRHSIRRRLGRFESVLRLAADIVLGSPSLFATTTLPGLFDTNISVLFFCSDFSFVFFFVLFGHKIVFGISKTFVLARVDSTTTGCCAAAYMEL